MSGIPDAIVVCGRTAQENHARLGYRADRMVSIPNGFDTTRFRPSTDHRRHTRAALGLNPDDVVIGNVARYHRYKGHPTLISALTRVAEDIPSARFVLVGNGVDAGNDRIRELIPAAMRERFLLLGVRADVHQLLPAFDLYVSSSIVEGFPNAIGEALACGVAVVATDVGDSRRLVGDAGVIVRPGDAAELAGAILRLLSGSRHALARLGESGRRRIVAEFSIAGMVDSYSSLYRRLAGDR